MNWRLLKDGLISYKEYLEYFGISFVIYNDFHVLKMLFIIFNNKVAIVFNNRVAIVFKKSVRSMIKAVRLWNETAIIFFFFRVFVIFIYWKWTVFNNYKTLRVLKIPELKFVFIKFDLNWDKKKYIILLQLQLPRHFVTSISE